MFEKIFEDDRLSKRERVERTLAFLPTDRAVLHDQLSYNPDLINHFSPTPIEGFGYTSADIGTAIKNTLDIAFILAPPKGTSTYTDDDGIVFRNDEWTRWIVERPFDDVSGAKEWLQKKTRTLLQRIRDFAPVSERNRYSAHIRNMQSVCGETVLLDIVENGFADVIDRMGLEMFSYMYFDFPDVFHEYIETSTELAILSAKAVADNDLSPVILIAEDFCAGSGPIHSPEFLKKEHYPFIKALAEAWREKGITVIYHTDGNFNSAIGDLLNCGVVGFYCLEKKCGMDIVALSREYPDVLFGGGVDGIDLLEFSLEEDVDIAVQEIIIETNAVYRGGILIGSSTEVNPSMPYLNYLSMVNATDKIRNDTFS